MRSMKLALFATATMVISAPAHATVVGSLGGGDGPFLELSSAGLAGGTIATLSGGTIYTSDQPFADIPKGEVFGGDFLAAGPLAGQPAILTFTAPVSYLSFLWGSPDTYNVLTLFTNQGSYTYSATSLGFPVTDGDQSFSDYVQFTATAGETISRVSFTNNPSIDAFEVANFSVTAVPEPATWGMMLVGFGMIGATARYRRRRIAAVFA